MTLNLPRIQPTRPRNRNHAGQPRRGFTLVEMLVAMGIAGFMIGLFYFIFNEATQAVSRGVQTSDIITKARAFQRQIEYETQTTISAGSDDSTPPTYASRMLGPKGTSYAPAPPSSPPPTIDNGGVLVIANHAISGVFMNEDRAQANQSNTVRSDQLMFMYDQGANSPNPKLANVAPSATNTYGADRKFAEESPAVRMWYGHVEVMPPNDANGDPATYDLGVNRPGSPNRYGAQWVLGRQAMFLRSQSATSLDNLVADATPPDYSTLVYATINDTTPSQTSGVGPGDAVRYPGYSSPFVRLGLTDLTEQTLQDLHDKYLNTAASDPAYHARVLGNSGTGMLFTNQRLRIIGDPRGAGGGANTGFETSTIARMHPYFLEGVSDFIVDWAGDYYQDTTPNNLTDNPGTPGQDGKIDRNTDGTIRWYSLLPGVPFGDQATAAAPGGPPVGYSQSSLARDPDGGTAGVRFDYPPTYSIPQAGSNPAYVAAPAGALANGGAMVWGNAKPGGGAQSGSDNWPFLIRIRYRVHDDQGRFSGRPINEGYSGNKAAVQQEYGRWFQVILPVNRQP